MRGGREREHERGKGGRERQHEGGGGRDSMVTIMRCVLAGQRVLQQDAQQTGN